MQKKKFKNSLNPLLYILTQPSNVEKVIQQLQIAYPESKTSLDFKNTYQLLVATMLSAQSTDKVVNTVTPSLFKKYPSIKELNKAKLDDLIEIIKTVGLYNIKAKNLILMSNKVEKEFNGEIPNTIKGLTGLPGVGRKTATAVLANAFGITDQGITVDTHMMRICRRLGWTSIEKSDATKIEKDLMNVIPQKFWGGITHLIIDHGRTICIAKNPRCPKCVIEEFCPSSLLRQIK